MMIEFFAAAFEVLVIIFGAMLMLSALVSSAFGERGIDCLLVAIVGAAIIWAAIHFGPITISLGGS